MGNEVCCANCRLLFDQTSPALTACPRCQSPAIGCWIECSACNLGWIGYEECEACPRCTESPCAQEDDIIRVAEKTFPAHGQETALSDEVLNYKAGALAEMARWSCLFNTEGTEKKIAESNKRPARARRTYLMNNAKIDVLWTKSEVLALLNDKKVSCITSMGPLEREYGQLWSIITFDALRGGPLHPGEAVIRHVPREIVLQLEVEGHLQCLRGNYHFTAPGPKVSPISGGKQIVA